MKISDFLKIKARAVITIAPGDTVSAAIQKLVEHNIGALPVLDKDGKLQGIVSERDLLKVCQQRANAIGSIKVQDVMTREVAFGTPADDLDYVVSVMQQKRIRHLPIITGQKLVGMVSIRDIVDMQLQEVKAEVRYSGLVRGIPPRKIV